MNKHSTLRSSGSLLERAAEIYDFSSGFRPSPAPAPAREERVEASRPLPVPAEPEPVDFFPEAEEAPAVQAAPAPEPIDIFELEEAEPVLAEAPPAPAPVAKSAKRPAITRSEETDIPAPAAYDGPVQAVDREALAKAGFIVPEAPATGLAEEFRMIKRQLLLGTRGKTGVPVDKSQAILVCSDQPNEGKTFSAINLALSLASEKEVEVLLVDGDFKKPEILSILGLASGPGLIDAIADPSADAEDFVIRTDIDGLSVLPAGAQANNVTELLASERTPQVLADLTARNPSRIVIFDSPPALMASPAAVLATHVGQVMIVVRADQTTEADLREAIALLSGCEHLSLMLNGAGFAATGRRFGSYYGYGQ